MSFDLFRSFEFERRLLKIEVPVTNQVLIDRIVS